jgi:hypothetical protein
MSDCEIYMIDPRYFGRLTAAVSQAINEINSGCNRYSATEYAAIEFNVSLCDVQARAFR